MPRIAVVTPILPVPFDVTRGRFIDELARALSRVARVRVFLQTARYPSLAGLRPRSYVHGRVDVGHALWEGLDVESYGYPALPVLTRPINGRVGGLLLRPRLRRFEPDVVLAYWAYPEGLSGVRAAHALGKPCVIGVLGSDVLLRSGALEGLTRTALQEADAVAAVSEDLRRVVVSRYGVPSDKVRTIVNGFNTSIFRPQARSACRAALGLRDAARLIVFVGRLIEAKGLRELLRAFESLAASDVRCELAIVGDGVMRQALHELVRASPCASRIHLPGGLPPPQVATWIGAGDLLTLPSWSEGYPNVVVEALACGRPVVASEVGGMREIVHESNGILVPPRDAQALADALREALAREWNREGIAAAMRRTWDDVARETLDLCESLRGAPG